MQPRFRVLVLLILTAALVSTQTSAHAEVRRFAVIVGANHGDLEQVPLRWAERDAERLAQVLVNVGGVEPDDLLLLQGEGAARVERSVQRFNQRIARYLAADSTRESVLLVFYSGHADANGLRLNGTQLDFRRLKALVSDSPADIRVLIVDACQSGEVTRAKGATAAAAFPLEIDERLEGEGVAIITSSAAGEDAQESDRLRGSFFTHAFLVGLQGAADASGDQLVTLNEAYKYAYTETLRATSRAPNLQHPTYSFQLRGRDDLVLTNLRGQFRGMGWLRLTTRGTYVVFKDSASGPIAAEVTVKDNKRLLLEAGTYVLRRRGAEGVYEAEVRVREGQLVALSRVDMKLAPYDNRTQKGAAPARVSASWGVSAGAGLGTELLPETGVLSMGFVSAHVEHAAWAFETGFRFGTSSAQSGNVTLDQSLMGVEFTAVRYLGTGGFSLGLGLRAGADRITQDIVDLLTDTRRVSWSGHWGPVMRLAYGRGKPLTAFVEGGADGYILNRVVDDNQAAAVGLELVPNLRAGLIFYGF